MSKGGVNGHWSDKTFPFKWTALSVNRTRVHRHRSFLQENLAVLASEVQVLGVRCMGPTSQMENAGMGTAARTWFGV